MKILLIPDKFKGSIAAKDVINALCVGIRASCTNVEIHSVVASDGGDGFLNAVAENVQCDRIEVDTTGPLGRSIQTNYLMDFKEKTAYIELAKASGLEILHVKERNAMQSSTYGTGIQIKDAITKGSKKLYIGLGGSATNDAGMGIAAALGYQFLEKNGNALNPIGENLIKVHDIKKGKVDDFKDVSIYAVNDVDNPLYGQKGAAYVYASQKGADKNQIKLLDEGLGHLSNIVKKQLNVDIANAKGAGAAGGTAYGLKAFLNADFISGIDFVLDLAQIDALLEKQSFDYIITGEGKFDEQTLSGKLIQGVVNLGKRYEIPVIVVCGQSEIDKTNLKKVGLEAVLEIRNPSMTLDYSMKNAGTLIENAIRDFFLTDRL